MFWSFTLNNTTARPNLRAILFVHEDIPEEMKLLCSNKSRLNWLQTVNIRWRLYDEMWKLVYRNFQKIGQLEMKFVLHVMNRCRAIHVILLCIDVKWSEKYAIRIWSILRIRGRYPALGHLLALGHLVFSLNEQKINVFHLMHIALFIKVIYCFVEKKFCWKRKIFDSSIWFKQKV